MRTQRVAESTIRGHETSFSRVRKSVRGAHMYTSTLYLGGNGRQGSHRAQLGRGAPAAAGWRFPCPCSCSDGVVVVVVVVEEEEEEEAAAACGLRIWK
jgi:hypothetical protein